MRPLFGVERPDAIYPVRRLHGQVTDVMSQAETKTYRVPFGSSKVDLVVEERGQGKRFLLLHGGAGPASMGRFAGLLAQRAKVFTPTHPGFARTARPDALNSPKALAQLYAAFLAQLGGSDVTVIGNSLGGWVAAELAILAPPSVCCYVLVGAGGVDVPGHPPTDVSKMTLPEIMSLSYYDPKPFMIDPTKLTDDQRAVAASNRAALAAYAPQNTDPTLAARLSKVRAPVLVISGEADRIVPPDYGRAFAAAIPGAKFQLLSKTGHVAQVETPELLLDAVAKFT